MKRNKNIDFVRDNWKIFPINMLYVTSQSRKLILNEEEKIYLYSIHRIDEVILEKLFVNSVFFDIYKVTGVDLNTTVGYVFNIKSIEDVKIRYTPVCITVTTPTCTKEAVMCSERKVLYSNGIYIMWLSCNAEMITILPTVLGIYPS